MRRDALWALLIGTGLVAGCQGTADTGSGNGDAADADAREVAKPAIEEPTPSTEPDAVIDGAADGEGDGEPAFEIERDAAPDFQVRELDGTTTVKLSDYRGKVVLISFWGID